MTPQERAEKIATEFGVGPDRHDRQEAVSFIAAQIEEAEREAVTKSVIESFGPQYRQQFAKGFSAAREMAKGIVEWHEAAIKRCQEVGITGDIVPLAHRIAKMEPPK